MRPAGPRPGCRSGSATCRRRRCCRSPASSLVCWRSALRSSEVEATLRWPSTRREPRAPLADSVARWGLLAPTRLGSPSPTQWVRFVSTSASVQRSVETSRSGAGRRSLEPRTQQRNLPWRHGQQKASEHRQLLVVLASHRLELRLRLSDETASVWTTSEQSHHLSNLGSLPVAAHRIFPSSDRVRHASSCWMRASNSGGTPLGAFRESSHHRNPNRLEPHTIAAMATAVTSTTPAPLGWPSAAPARCGVLSQLAA